MDVPVIVYNENTNWSFPTHNPIICPNIAHRGTRRRAIEPTAPNAGACLCNHAPAFTYFFGHLQ
jgi:hypothetical protein